MVWTQSSQWWNVAELIPIYCVQEALECNDIMFGARGEGP